MAHKTQEQRVISKIKEQGFITRNQCLSTFPAITRLGAIICSLKKEGKNGRLVAKPVIKQNIWN